jgi:hypothetical protein
MLPFLQKYEISGKSVTRHLKPDAHRLLPGYTPFVKIQNSFIDFLFEI